MVLETVTDKIYRKQKALAHMDCIASPMIIGISHFGVLSLQQLFPA